MGLDLFKPYLSNDFNVKEKSFIDKRTNIKYSSVNLATLSLPCFNYYRNIFYNSDNLKIIPSNIQNLLSPRGLAYWIMDDGYFDSYGRTKTVLLCTESFTKDECIILQSLLEKLDIKSTLKVRDKIHNRYRIRISKTSMDRVISLVKPYIHKDFLYKLGI